MHPRCRVRSGPTAHPRRPIKEKCPAPPQGHRAELSNTTTMQKYQTDEQAPLQMVSFFKTVKSTQPAGEHAAADVLAMITNPPDAIREKVKKIRDLVSAGKDAAADAIKKTLPAVTFSGTFSKRGKAGLSAHSGLVVLDFDDLTEDRIQLLGEIIEDRIPVAFLFRSPSGSGLKVGVSVNPVPQNAAEHEKAFSIVEGVFTEAGFPPDKSGRDVCRLCFLSFDPDALVGFESHPLDVSGQSGTGGMADAGGRGKFDTAKVGSAGVSSIPECHADVRRHLASNNRERLLSKFGKPYIATRFKNEMPTAFRINERFMAARLAAEGQIVRDPDANSFFRYSSSSGLWENLTEDMLAGDAGGLIDAELRMGGDGALVPTVTGRMCREVVAHCRAMAEARDFFVDRPDIIVCANGALSVSALGIDRIPWSPNHRARHSIKVAFDPHADCPETQSRLMDLNFSPDDSATLWKYLGMILLGKNLVQRLLLIHGRQAGTGKSVAVNLATILSGGNVAQLRPHLLNDRFETSRYVGKSLLVAPDVSSGFMNSQAAQAVKTLVGGDMIQPEGKHEGASPSFKAEFPVLVTSNVDLFVYADTDTSAWRRRLIWLETSGKKPEKKIHNYEQVLWQKEAPGIFRRALEGLVQLYRDLQEVGDIRLTSDQERHVDVLLGQSNSVRSFVEECLAFGRGQDITKEELTTAYFDFCEVKGWKPSPDHGEKLKRMLQENHVLESSSVQRGGKAVRGYRGVSLRGLCAE
jgi:putative DNA primase/helicase